MYIAKYNDHEHLHLNTFVKWGWLLQYALGLALTEREMMHVEVIKSLRLHVFVCVLQV